MTPHPPRIARALVAVALLSGIIQLSSVASASVSVLPAPPGLDHFKCYSAEGIAGDPYEFPHGRRATLTDQFGSREMVIGRQPVRLCNPVTKILPDGTPFPAENQAAHLVCFKVKEPAFTTREVMVQNQFGTARLKVIKTLELCAPSWKSATPDFPPEEQPPGLDHFLCYSAAYSTVVVDHFEAIPPSVRLIDQFGTTANRVGAPKELCNPVEKKLLDHVSPVTNPAAHLVCFKTTNAFTAVTPYTKNQFGQAQLNVIAPELLCLPSFKAEVPPG